MSGPAGNVATASPLMIGVTGHRRLRDADGAALQAQVRRFLVDLQQRYPALPLVLLSPLAEGGDRIAADAAFALGIRVIAPLPLPLAQYRDDFEGPDSLALFEAQLARAEPLFLPVRHHDGDDATQAKGPARDRQYAEVGIFMSRHCHILLALWDGLPAGEVGGTAHTVRFHLQGEMPGIDEHEAWLDLLGVVDNSLVRHIPAHRHGAMASADAGGARWITGNGEVSAAAAPPQPFDGMFRCQAAFNADVRTHADAIGVAASAAGPAPAPDGAPADRVACPIRRRFEAADWLASTYQHRVTRVLRITYGLAAATGFAFILYAHVHSQDAMIYLYLLLFASGVGLALLARRRQWHRKYLDYRALAEGLRVQSYWRQAGVVDVAHPSTAQDSFMQEQDVELGWIRNVLRAASLEGMCVPVRADAAAIEAVVGEWVGDVGSGGQLAYFTATAVHRARMHRRAQWVAHACLATGIGISVLLAIFAHRLDTSTKTALVVAMGLLSVAAGVHEAYVHKKADKELVKQYRFMQRIFEGARRRLDACSSVAAKRRVLQTLGEAALAEHAEWTLMHRERPLEHTRLG